MKKILIFLIFIFLLLTSWQIYRFYSKKYKADFLLSKNELLIDANNIPVELGNQINQDRLYKKLTLCGKYQTGEAFLLYKPKNGQLDNSLIRLDYEVILPLYRNDEIILVNYVPSDANSLDQLEVYINQTKSQDMCFSGILLDMNRMASSWLNRLFIKNNAVNNIWLRLDLEDLKIKFPEHNIDYFLDSNLENLTRLIKGYKHHLYYAIMWFCLVLYSLYLLIKKNNN